MNIHDTFNKETFENCFAILNNFDSYKIVDGNICFFKNEPCDECNTNTEGANPINFIKSNEPYTLEDVADVLTPGHSYVKFQHRETEGELEPIEETGGYGCYDCKTKIDGEE